MMVARVRHDLPEEIIDMDYIEYEQDRSRSATTGLASSSAAMMN
jgi:hypothetical protein